mgnify:CR=1 FL=1|tara:strand:+ start:5184 stop:5522 length:339 start_codon:yes stop_codon:yes gene_type:complete
MKKMSLEKCHWFYKGFSEIHVVISTQISQICTLFFYGPFILKEETYQIIDLCMEVHKILGKGHSEKVYGDALEYEFNKNNIPYKREERFTINYKEIPYLVFIMLILWFSNKL